MAPRPGGVYCDGTVGSGGHAEALLAASGPDGVLLGVDRDGEVLAVAAVRLRSFGERVRLIQGDYRELPALAHAATLGPFDGILLDLGVSSLQLDDPTRGFSFAREGPLDMRMDRAGGGSTAGELLGRLGERELVAILREYGEERWARRIAQVVVAARARGPIATTKELANLVARAIPRAAWPARIHPATRTFQALRIAVNRELAGLGQGLEAAASLLAAGGRLAVVSFHSLEDRAVKTTFRRLAVGQGMTVLTRKPVTPGRAELAANPRGRSAKLRVIQMRNAEGGTRNTGSGGPGPCLARVRASTGPDEVAR